MRHLPLTFISILMLASCAPRHDGYSISGTLRGDAEGARVILADANDDPSRAIDSAIVKEGKFHLQGSVESPGMYSIIIDTNEPGTAEPDYRNKKFKVNFYLENSDITFDGNIDSLPAYYYNPQRNGSPVITGSESQALYESYKNSIKDITVRLSDLDRQYSQEYLIPELDGQDATLRGIEIVKAEKALNAQKKDATWRFIRDNASSVVAFDEASYIINGYISAPTSAEIDSLLLILEPAWKGSPRYESLKENVAVTRKLAIGEPYIDIELLTTGGEKVMLSSLVPKDKYVMLEFWASWCGPCRGEIPHLAKVHRKYPDFEIISISVDSDEEAWAKAMKEEGMTWTQLRNPDGMDGDVRDKYNIYGVPTCIVLDKAGRFHLTNMRGAYLDEFLARTYGF